MASSRRLLVNQPPHWQYWKIVHNRYMPTSKLVRNSLSLSRPI